jgi:hypothetical protein
MKAMGCAKSAIAPLRMAPGQLERIRANEKDTLVAVARTARAVGRVTHWLALAARTDPPSDLVKAARAQLT